MQDFYRVIKQLSADYQRCSRAGLVAGLSNEAYLRKLRDSVMPGPSEQQSLTNLIILIGNKIADHRQRNSLPVSPPSNFANLKIVHALVVIMVSYTFFTVSLAQGPV